MSALSSATAGGIGHTDVSGTAKIYTHKSRGTDGDMAQAMGELIELAASGGHSQQRLWVRIGVQTTPIRTKTHPTNRC